MYNQLNNVLKVFVLTLGLLFPGTFASMGQQKGLTHPWMIFSPSDIPAIKAKLAKPENNKIYQSLTSGTGLKYALYGDMTDALAVKNNIYNLILSARSRMVATDAWGTFQWGRRMQENLIPLSLVINSSIFTQAERDRLQLSCDSIAWRFRDLTYCTERGAGGINNRTLDEIMGIAFAGVFMFPDSPNAANHWAYFSTELEREMKYVQADGTWPEVSRYVGVVIVKCLTLFSSVQRRYLGNNTGLVSDPRFKSILQNFMQGATAKDVLFQNRRYAPAVGDTGNGENNYAFLSWAASEMALVDTTLSKQLQGMWKLSGSDYSTVAPVLIADILATADASAPMDTTFVLPSLIQKNLGYYIFRNNYGKPTESNVTIHLPGMGTYHRHYDCGSFIFYANNTPLFLDSGVGDYAEPDVAFYKSTVNHNVVTFKDATGADVNGKDYNPTNLSTLLSDDYDFVQANITPSNNLARSYIRNMGYVKSIFNTLVVFDCVDADGIHTNNFHTLTTATDSSVVNGFKRTISHGYNNMDIEMTHLLPIKGISLSKVLLKPGIANTPASWPHNLADRKDAGDMNNCYTQWIGINNSGTNHYLTVIRPKGNTEAESSVSSLSITNINCKAFRVDVIGKGSFIIVINPTIASQSAALSLISSEGLQSLSTKTSLIRNSSGKFDVSVASKSMEIFMLKSQIANSLDITDYDDNLLKISPVPSRGLFTIDSKAIGARYTVTNMEGRTITMGEISDSHQILDLTPCTAGVYVLKLYIGNSVLTRKLVTI